MPNQSANIWNETKCRKYSWNIWQNAMGFNLMPTAMKNYPLQLKNLEKHFRSWNTSYLNRKAIWIKNYAKLMMLFELRIYLVVIRTNHQIT